MKTKMKTIIISLGGSLIVPNEIDSDFLKRLKRLVLDFVKKGNKAIIICGGGKTCRNYYKAAGRVNRKINTTNYDWLGIMATRLNAELVRVIFGNHAYKKVIYNPNGIKNFGKILIGAGWIPGWSTDYDSVVFAKSFKSKTIINMTNISYVYTKDPRKYKDAKPIREISWKDYRKIIGNKWVSGLNWPFDPVASRIAQKYGIKVIILNGKNLRNLKNCLEGKKFKGTIIR